MKTYAEYYELSKQNYLNNSEPIDSKLDLYKLTMNVVRPDEESDLIERPPNYLDLINSLSERVNQKVADPSQHFVDPSAKGAQIAVQVLDIWDMPELEIIASSILPSLEKNVFNSYIHLSAIHAYRNIQTPAKPVSSWLWHYDNNPKEAVKVLIYLTDVGEKNAPFELLQNDAGEHIKMETSRTGYNHWGPAYVPQSRIPPDMMEKFRKLGYKEHKITGPAGTILFFDNNIVHRANIPEEGYRDVVILNIRPTMDKIRPYISKDTTGSWGFKSPIPNPAHITPIKNR